jgi:osmotically-inducible protein OsmY
MEGSAMTCLKRLAAVFLAVTMVSVAGCAGDRKHESTGEYVSDSWITTKVKAVLVEDPIVKATEVNIETFKGAVQLSGFVSTRNAMDQAVRLTRDVKGVTSVKNDMRLK